MSEGTDRERVSRARGRRSADCWPVSPGILRSGLKFGKKNVPVTSEDRLIDALGRAADCFRRCRVDYALVGAWALSVWGRPRATLDIDFLVMVNEEELASLGDRMARSGMPIDQTWLHWNPLLKGSQLRLQYRGVAVDLLRPRDLHDRQVFRRRKRKRLGGRYYWIVAPEDFILQKLKVGRPRDFEDALTVLERSGHLLDRKYLSRWADRLGVGGEWAYLRRGV